MYQRIERSVLQMRDSATTTLTAKWIAIVSNGLLALRWCWPYFPSRVFTISKGKREILGCNTILSLVDEYIAPLAYYKVARGFHFF
jgi:hypothetical protein